MKTYGGKNKVNFLENHCEVLLENKAGDVVAKALVDFADLDKILEHRWHLTNYGYARTKLKISQHMHSYILGKTGVDHNNGNRLDNRRGNLRPATQVQNNANRKPNKKYKGIHKISNNRYRACTSVNNQTTHIGYFKTPEEAAYAYDQVALQLHGEYAWTNFEY